ncbi:RagB/SusD family nutrient uptake outer membrane protein [Sphingobacterium sp. LRF_L2]|uniref:RagB/SusD family nutrient uptake outer membrane protein n=1 Tax=Sphingobacterium sp. LRF_L2 TaxID=3369421 RepID=UPI003F5FA699
MKYIARFFSLLLLFVITSCSKDYLSITPDGRTTLEDIFQDEKRTEAYLNRVYGYIPSYFWKYGFFDFLAPFSDEAYAYSGAVMAWSSGSLNASGNPLHTAQERGKGVYHYGTFWAGIRDANVFLSNVETANIPSSTNRARFKGEAQLLRTFYFWELIKEYGPMPIINTPFDNDFDYTTLVRPTFQECVDYIEEQCDEVIANNNVPMRITTEAERGRVTRAMALAIKSQALLYNASPLWNEGNDLSKWEKASLVTQEAIQLLTAQGYQLVSDYGDYFLSKTDINSNPRDKETIYEVHEAQVDPVFSIINSIPSKPGMFKVGTTPSQELVDSYDMQQSGEPAIVGYQDADHLQPIINTSSGYDPANPYLGRDPRFYASVWYNGASYDNIGGNVHIMETYIGGADQLLKAPLGWAFTRTGYYLRKFVDPRLQSGQPEDTRWKKYRLAELYLNLAEAENEANGPSSIARDAINVVRSRAQMPGIPTGLTKEQFRERIRRERRVELAFEEHRFWDVRRWKILDQTDKLVTGMEITKRADNTFSYARFVTERRSAWSDKFRILPIPIKETSIIPDFDLNQNPGW